jgi:hypothetical protein
MIERLLHRVSAFMFAFLMVTAVFDGTQACATIYHEFSLGHGGRPGSGQFPISDAGWSAHFGLSATPVPVPADPHDAPANWEAGFVRNFEALATDGRHPSNPLRDGDVLLWTENLQQRVACEDVALLQFAQKNADAEIAPHPTLRIDGQWYVTARPSPQQSIRFTTESLRNSFWKRLRFVPGTQLSRDQGDPMRFDSLAGKVDGVGLFYPGGSIRGRVRLQSTELLTHEGMQRRMYLDTITLPTVDLSDRPEQHHTIVAQGTERHWQGHPSTVLMPDGKTIFCVWQGRRDGNRAHGAPAGYLKRSDDGGLTWSEELHVPANWLEIGTGHPTIHRLVDPEGVARLFIFCRDETRSTFLQAVSEDEGETWSEMRPIGLIDPEGEPITGWTAPITILEATDPDGVRKHLMWYEKSRDGRPSVGVIWQSASYDGGLTWGGSKPVVDKAGASEPGAVRSPDGKQLLLLIRENSRTLNSLFAVSDDEGETWSEPRLLPLALTGDRHLARYAPDGRLVVVFRPFRPRVGRSWDVTDSHFTAWVGRYEDILEGREGQTLIKLIHSHAGADHTYPGLELLPDGTFVATTYINYQPLPELHSVVSCRFHLEEIDILWWAIKSKKRTTNDR